MPLGGAPTCPCCGDKVYFSEEKAYAGKSWHKKCFRCEPCKKPLEKDTANMAGESLICNNCLRQLEKENKQTGTQKEKYVNKEDPECCPRCGTRVYFAETILAIGRKFHKACHNCGSCNKKIESSKARDHEGDIYCWSCHSRLFGPKGYGFAGGSGMGLSMDTGKAGDVITNNIPQTAQAYVAPKLSSAKTPDNDDTDAWDPNRCPRCARTVYLAEQRHGAGNVYHSSCFSCLTCNKKLDATTITEKEGEIYCKGCYGQRFAPKGYGFGIGAGILSSTH